MKSRNTGILILMSISIILLLMLQGLWLANSYEKGFYDLRRNMNYVFQNTLFTIRDSVFVKNIKPLITDSLGAPKNFKSIQIFEKKQADTSQAKIKSSTLQVFVSSNGDDDSIAKALQPLVHHFDTRPQDGKSFVIRLTDDPISLDTMKILFSKTLRAAGFPASFVLKRKVSTERLIQTQTDLPPRDTITENQTNAYSDTLYLEPIRINPVSQYSASIVDFKSYILSEIAPQILFSILLTVFTLAAFVVLYKSLRSQQRLMELKNDFISNVTHELKTPVATVSVALEALKNFHALSDPARTTEYLDIAQNELNRLTLMTDKILKASSFDSNGIVIQRETVDLSTTVTQILDSLKLVFEKHQAHVSFNKEGSDFSVPGSQSHISNVLYNLLDNALKYSPGQPQLAITLKNKNENVVLTVQDNGIGIPSEYKNKIFEKFFRVPAGDIHTIKGYGLGLSYVASVVKEHNGSIEVTSEYGKGSTFILQFPRS